MRTIVKLSRRQKQLIACQLAIRRQRLSLMIAALSALLVKPNYRGPTVYRPIFSFESYVTGLSDTFFCRLYRMPKDAFLKLADKLTFIRAQSGMRFSKSSPLLRLSVTLRWLAGGSYLDVCLAHGLWSSSMYYYLWQTLDEIDKALDLKFPYDDEAWLQASSREFTRGGRSPLYGCCAALDGLAVKIWEPSRDDVPNTSTYFNRKGFFAINFQAACDATYRFVYASGLAAGSTHDSTAFGMSNLGTMLNRATDTLLKGFWIACDEAYSATEKVLTPWPGRRLSRERDCFNYWLSSARIHIEQAFGLLVARWGILWRPMRLKVGKAAKLTVILCKLHNYILDETQSCDVPTQSGWDNRFHTATADYNVKLQDECDLDYALHCRLRDLEDSDLRSTFTEEIKDAGLRRPSVY